MNKRIYIQTKRMIKELELRFLGIEAKFFGGLRDLVTTETYYSERYKCLVAVFRDLPNPILAKHGWVRGECWHNWINIKNTDNNIDINNRYCNKKW